MTSPLEDLIRTTLTELAEEAPPVRDQLPPAQRRVRNRRRVTVTMGAVGALAAVLIAAPLAVARTGSDAPQPAAPTAPPPGPAEPTPSPRSDAPPEPRPPQPGPVDSAAPPPAGAPSPVPPGPGGPSGPAGPIAEAPAAGQSLVGTEVPSRMPASVAPGSPIPR